MKYPTIIFLFIFILSGCTKDDNPVIPNEHAGFGIYFLADSSIKIQDLLGKDISQLKLQSTPWISDKDIDFYDWSSHCIYLKNDMSYFFPKNQGKLLIPDNWRNKPFVIVADGKICYAGFTYLVKFNDVWPFPAICDYDIRRFPDDIVYLDWPFFPANDKRNNENIKTALANLNILHQGLDVTIDSLWIDNADTASIRYKFTVKNIDNDNLYVLDPDKMGTELFHYFTNGPIFYNISKMKIYESVYKKITKPDPYDYYDKSWFIKLESGKSITRMITLKGYPHLPKGEFLCRFMFTNPVNISKQNRILPDGRYWIGYTSSRLMGFNLE